MAKVEPKSSSDKSTLPEDGDVSREVEFLLGHLPAASEDFKARARRVAADLEQLIRSEPSAAVARRVVDAKRVVGLTNKRGEPAQNGERRELAGEARLTTAAATLEVRARELRDEGSKDEKRKLVIEIVQWAAAAAKHFGEQVHHLAFAKRVRRMLLALDHRFSQVDATTIAAQLRALGTPSALDGPPAIAAAICEKAGLSLGKSAAFRTAKARTGERPSRAKT